jgi:hypothetical protein
MSKAKSYFNRYKQLSIWSKFGLWGSIASLIGLLFIFLPHLPNIQQTMNNSPGSKQIAGDYIVSPTPKRGLRLLNTKSNHFGNKIKTRYEFGSLAVEKLTTYTIHLRFSKPYEGVETSFESQSFIEAHGGLDGQSANIVDDKLQYTLSGRDLGATKLIVEFIAPYEMNAISVELSPKATDPVEDN